MATGDEALAAGMTLVPGTGQAKDLDQYDNETRDYLARFFGRIWAGVRGTSTPPSTATVRSNLGLGTAALYDQDRSATADTIARRWGNGSITGPMPASNGEYAPKLYVDQQISAAIGSIPAPSSDANAVTAAAYGREAGASRFVMWMDGARLIGRSSSTRRHKNDITPYEFDTDALLTVPVVSFIRDVDAENSTRDIGLIAEDLADAGLEDLIYRGDDGKVDGIHDHRLVYALLAVVQHQATALDLLAQRLDRLEK